jgi:hypothetical protein
MVHQMLLRAQLYPYRSVIASADWHDPNNIRMSTSVEIRTLSQVLVSGPADVMTQTDTSSAGLTLGELQTLATHDVVKKHGIT